MTDPSSPKAAPPDRWQRWADRLTALARGASRFWHHVRELWKRMADALHEEDSSSAYAPPSSVPPRRRTERRDVSIRVPAKDRAFNFIIDTSFTWSSDRLGQEALSSFARYYTSEVIARLSRVAADHARGFASHHAAELEAALTQVLTQEDRWPYPPDTPVATCQPRVRVRPDERAVEIAKPYWEELIRIELDFEVRKRRAECAAQLTRQVTRILEDVRGSLATGGTAGQANDNLTTDVDRLLAELRASLRRLENEFRKTLRDSDIFGRADGTPREQPNGKPSGGTPQAPHEAAAAGDHPSG